MTIIFLDVDGVLNNQKFLNGTKDDIYTDDFTDRDVIDKQLDPENVKNLNKIISVSQCNVVLSSSWRKFISLKDFTWGLVKHGMKKEFAKNFISKTPITGKREEEINEWIKASKEKIDKYVVIDDSRDKNDNLKGFDGKWVKINPKKGLTLKKADKVINILTK